jgi:hypothetical protein
MTSSMGVLTNRRTSRRRALAAVLVALALVLVGAVRRVMWRVGMVYIPGGMAPGAHYALAHWCETRTPDGTCTMVSSPGAFGVYPWIDRTSGLYGLFFLRHRLPAVADGLRAARVEILKPAAP